MKNVGLILEGGGTRGVFTAGVLDYFMECQLEFNYIIGVSAGAGNAISYVAKQIERTKKCTIDSLENEKYVSVKKFVKDKMLFDMDLIFDKFPNELYPFDYDTYFNSGTKCILGLTNCETGEPYYFEEMENRDKSRLMQGCRASSSLPYISPVVMIDGIPMLDGGLSDPIPIRKALRDGIKKNVVILTRPLGYRKKLNRKQSVLSRKVYKDYPNLSETMDRRRSMYNKTMELIERLEQEGHILVIRPQVPPVDRMEQDSEVLTQFYNHGYDYAKEIYNSVLQFLGKELQ